LAMVVAAGLSACSSGGMDMNPGALVSGGRDVAKEQETVRRFAAVQVCPEVQPRQGTEVLRQFARGKQDDPDALLYQATLRTLHRECAVSADGGSVVKVGIAGRLIAGPSGFDGQANLPLRVVVLKNGNEVLYSQMHPVAASVTPGQGSGPWTQVVDGITIPYQSDAGRFVIYVGFDEMAGS
jgi:hypothetical protein